MATEGEHTGYALGMALIDEFIKAMGGDPKRPTKKQAKAAARFMIDIARVTNGGTLPNMTAGEISTLYDEIKRERQ